MIYLVSRSISQGRIAWLISLSGTFVGFVVYMTLANLGLAVVFVVVPWLHVAFRAAGVAISATWLGTPSGAAVGCSRARELPRDPGCFTLGAIQIGLSMTVNAGIVSAAGAIAQFLK